MSAHPAAPAWDAVKRPDHGKRRDGADAEEDQARLTRLWKWIDWKLTHAVYSPNAPQMTDAEFDEFMRSGLTAGEQALLLREIERKRAAKGEKRKRGDKHFPEIAEALRSSPSPRFLRVVADMIEIGFFTGRVELDADFAVVETTETRQRVLEVLVDAYGDVPKNILEERATDLTPFFRVDRDRWERDWEDLHKEVQDYNKIAADEVRMRTVRLLYSIRRNSWPPEK